MLRSGLTKSGFRLLQPTVMVTVLEKSLNVQARKWPQPQRMDIAKEKKGLFRARWDCSKAESAPSLLVVEGAASGKTSGLEAGKSLVMFCVRIR